jgi:hypothetical protein
MRVRHSQNYLKSEFVGVALRGQPLGGIQIGWAYRGAATEGRPPMAAPKTFARYKQDRRLESCVRSRSPRVLQGLVPVPYRALLLFGLSSAHNVAPLVFPYEINYSSYGHTIGTSKNTSLYLKEET